MLASVVKIRCMMAGFCINDNNSDQRFNLIFNGPVHFNFNSGWGQACPSGQRCFLNAGGQYCGTACQVFCPQCQCYFPGDPGSGWCGRCGMQLQFPAVPQFNTGQIDRYSGPDFGSSTPYCIGSASVFPHQIAGTFPYQQGHFYNSSAIPYSTLGAEGPVYEPRILHHDDFTRPMLAADEVNSDLKISSKTSGLHISDQETAAPAKTASPTNTTPEHLTKPLENKIKTSRFEPESPGKPSESKGTKEKAGQPKTTTCASEERKKRRSEGRKKRRANRRVLGKKQESQKRRSEERKPAEEVGPRTLDQRRNQARSGKRAAELTPQTAVPPSPEETRPSHFNAVVGSPIKIAVDTRGPVAANKAKIEEKEAGLTMTRDVLLSPEETKSPRFAKVFVGAAIDSPPKELNDEWREANDWIRNFFSRLGGSGQGTTHTMMCGAIPLELPFGGKASLSSALKVVTKEDQRELHRCA